MSNSVAVPNSLGRDVWRRPRLSRLLLLLAIVLIALTTVLYLRMGTGTSRRMAAAGRLISLWSPTLQSASAHGSPESSSSAAPPHSNVDNLETREPWEALTFVLFLENVTDTGNLERIRNLIGVSFNVPLIIDGCRAFKDCAWSQIGARSSSS
jgi:hypothetical protein